MARASNKEDCEELSEESAVDLALKNQELLEKIQEFDMLKLKYEESFNNYQSLNQQVNTNAI